MENNCRILNRIVEINIANVKYTDLELSGNTCFVGTNNFGKTSLQRAILFFYSANSRGLGKIIEYNPIVLRLLLAIIKSLPIVFSYPVIGS